MTPAPDAVLKALADPHRRQILRLVQYHELAAGQIAAEFPAHPAGGQWDTFLGALPAAVLHH